jgi:CHAT domain-containing protein
MLSADANTPFSRFLPVSKPWRGPVQGRLIRVLAVISDPSDLPNKYNLPRADVALEQKTLESAFATVGRDKLIWDFLQGPVTLGRLEQEMHKGYHVLHVLSHGAFSTKRQQAALYLQNEDGTAKNVLDSELAGMLARQGVQPHLVFLAACQSATRSTADAFLGLGPKLVSIGVPAVVAMQDVVTVATVRRFSEVFYRQLLEHGQVDLATNEARSTLLTARRPDAAVPVLFMRLKSGRLWADEDLDTRPPAQS